MAFNPRMSDIVIDVGGDVWKRYGTLTQRSWPADRHGEDAKETHTRASAAGLITNGGLFNPAGNNIPRVTWIKDANGVYQPRLLLEPDATNKLTFPEDISNAAWTKIGATVPSTISTSPRNDATASFVREDSSTGGHFAQQSITITAGNSVGAAFFIRSSGRNFAQLQITDNVSRFFGVEINLTTGVITPIAGGGGATLTFSSITPLANLWYRVELYGVIGGAVTTVYHSCFIESSAGVTSYTGGGTLGVYLWGCVATDNQPTGMYWGTGASRSQDKFTLPYPYKPQPMAVYDKFVNVGALWQYSSRILTIGNGGSASGGYLSILPRSAAADGFRVEYSNNLTYGNCFGLPSPVFGDTVELLFTWDATGLGKLYQSINGGAESSVTGTAIGLPTAFDTAFFNLIGMSDGSQQAVNVAHARAMVFLNTLPSSVADVRAFLATVS